MNRYEFHPEFTVDAFTKGKKSECNEDSLVIAENCLAVFDGATDKTGLKFEEDPESGLFRTGGEIASRIGAKVVAQSNAVGIELAKNINSAISSYYEQYNPKAINDSSFRFATTMVAAKILDDTLVVTQIGDSWYRINGEPFTNDKKVDEIRAQERQAKIKELLKEGVPVEEAAVQGREAILPELKKQHLLQNNPDDKLGYGALDGSEVPNQEPYIIVKEFALSDISTIDIVSDGYPILENSESTVENFENEFRRVEEEDPYHYIINPGTKPGIDDRTVVIATR